MSLALFTLCLISRMSGSETAGGQCRLSERSVSGKALKGHTFKEVVVKAPFECQNLCENDHRCKSYNFNIPGSVCEMNSETKETKPNDFVTDDLRFYITVKREDVDECTASSPVCDVNANCTNTRGSYLCTCKSGFSGDGKSCKAILGYFPENPGQSCLEIKTIEGKKAISDKYWLSDAGSIYQVYCHMESTFQGWTLIARFSQSDEKHWMYTSGRWWYYKTRAVGSATDPSSNTDMISLAFWLVSGNEFKITRSDDPQHTSLLQTTCDCLGGQTFRSKITGYGDFRNGATWRVNNRCLGNCTVQYGGQYETTKGFFRAKCNGTIQSADKIGFWCDRGMSDGAVMMIGGAGTGACGHTQHGIGVTAAHIPSFDAGGRVQADFGDSPNSADTTNDFSLNLWVR